MKGILNFLGVVVLAFIVFSAFAQQVPGNLTLPIDKMNIQTTSDEYVYMKEGTMMLYKNGKESVLAEVFNCTDGSKVATDGTVTKKDGTTYKLKNGDKVLKDGHIISQVVKPEDK